MKNLSNLTTRHVLALLLIVALALSLLSLLENPGGWTPEWRSNWFGNLSSEILGAVITFLLFDRILARRTEKARLIREMGSPDNATALNAVRELAAEKWLFDGSLQNAHLGEANLRRANLYRANLQGTDLCKGNLQNADLENANLQGIHWVGSNLLEAYLLEANLQHADLENSSLQGAELRWATLQGAILLDTNLQGTRLEDVVFDEATMLPDGTHWTPSTDLSRFTNPAHPNFWRSFNPASAAYHTPSD